MSTDGSSSDEEIYNFSAIYDRKMKEYKERIEKIFETKNLNTDDSSSSNTISLLDDEQPATELETSDIIDLDDYDDGPIASTSKIVTRSRGRTQRRFLPSAPVTESIAYCIGDFDDGYNIPPPIIKPVEDKETMLARLKREREKEEDDNYLILELNRIVNVKVSWCQGKVHKFSIRKFQSIESIYEHFATLEKVDKSEILLRLNGKRLSPSDTPTSINYTFIDLIDGEVEFYRSMYDKSVTEEVNEPDDEVKVKVLTQNKKRPLLISMKKTDQMAIVYIKLSEQLGLDMKSFTLEFDGEKVDKSGTLESLDLDGDECFELFEKIKK